MLLWTGVALLGVTAFLFVIWPLIRHSRVEVSEDRQQTNITLYRQHLAELEAGRDSGSLSAPQFEQLKVELETSLLDDSDVNGEAVHPGRISRGGQKSLLLLALLLPLVGAGLYWQWGAGQDWEIRQLLAESHEQQLLAQKEGRSVDASNARELIAKLEARLEQAPEHQQNWFLLARTLMGVQDYMGAVRAYQKVLSFEPNSGQVLGEFAQALFIAGGNRITPEVESLTRRALQVMPDNPTALGLAGVAAFEKRDFQLAINRWQQALQVMGTQSPGAPALMAGIARAQAELKATGTTGPEKAESAATGSAEQSISLRVTLADDVPRRDDQVIFVYARAWQGPKMPLAIQRLRVSDLPIEVRLDESMAMAPGMTIASVPEIELVARLSQDGSATAKSGDWLATLGPIRLADKQTNLHLEIASQLP